MKKMMMAAAALCCMIMLSMSVSSCANSDNPIERAPRKPTVKMADAIKVHVCNQSFYKIDTKEIQPFYVIFDNIYVDEKGDTLYYDLSDITEISFHKFSLPDLFTIDTTTLVKHGYIKLIPNLNHNEIKQIAEELELFETAEGIGINLVLKSKWGEEMNVSLMPYYVYPTVLKIQKTIKVSDLDSKKEYAVDLSDLEFYKLSKWSLSRYSDVNFRQSKNGIIGGRYQEDGKLYLRTLGKATDSDKPATFTWEFSRKLVGIPYLLIPEEDGMLVNFRVEVELTITE